MQELFEILTHKLSLINNKQPSNLANAEKDELLDELIIEKKKEVLRILVQTRLQQSIDSKRVSIPEELNHILEKTHRIMSIQDKDLQLPPREDPLISIIELYINFFNRQNCTHRAQEIANIHKKKLCPKGLMPSTFFNWFVQWVRKQFQQYLKTTIHSLYVDSRHPKPQQKEEPQKQKETSEQTNFLLIQKKPPIPSMRSLAASHREKRPMLSVELDQKKIERTRLKSQSPSEKSLRFGSIESIQADQSLPINKEVFYYAYEEQIQTLYKSLESCIPNLDMGYVRKLKRGGRRKEVKKRIKEVANNIIKQMIPIKEGIEKYYKEYITAHHLEDKRIAKKTRKSSIERLEKSESPSKTSHGNRSISSEMIDQRRKSIISSLSKNHRYADIDQESNIYSNLLPAQQKSIPKPKKQHQYGKTIEMSFSSPRNNHESKLLLLNAGNISAELEIIQQKAKKIKARASKQNHHSLHHHKKEHHKAKLSKSINLIEQSQMQVAFSSLPVTIDVSMASHLRLPKIRRLK